MSFVFLAFMLSLAFAWAKLKIEIEGLDGWAASFRPGAWKSTFYSIGSTEAVP